MSNPFEASEATGDYAAISVTLKAAAGYDAPWIVVRGESAEKVTALLKDLWEKNLGGAVIATASALHSEYQTEKGGGNAVERVVEATQGQVIAYTPDPAYVPGPTSPALSAPAPQAPAAQGVGPSCKHGPRVYRSGNGSRGKWQAWFCPSPKGTPDQCDPQWIK